jgi:hypothetical protein
MRIRSFLLASLIVTSPVAAQTGSAPAATSPVADVRLLWAQVRDYIARSADDMSEAKYTYRPTPEVRSFGELIGHLAGSQNMFCAIALGEKPPAEDAVEKSRTSKPDLVKAWSESNSYCERAYAQSDAALAGTTDLLRMNGMIPPSSKPR